MHANWYELAPMGRSYGFVARSSAMRIAMASSRVLPHMSGLGRSEAQNAGRSGFPNSLQRIASSSCTQRIPAGLPCGMPGIGELIDGAMQQAPQWLRQEIEGIDITLAV